MYPGIPLKETSGGLPVSMFHFRFLETHTLALPSSTPLTLHRLTSQSNGNKYLLLRATQRVVFRYGSPGNEFAPSVTCSEVGTFVPPFPERGGNAAALLPLSSENSSSSSLIPHFSLRLEVGDASRTDLGPVPFKSHRSGSHPTSQRGSTRHPGFVFGFRAIDETET